jgi:predicted O-methyltransferase YrrM
VVHPRAPPLLERAVAARPGCERARTPDTRGPLDDDNHAEAPSRGEALVAHAADHVAAGVPRMLHREDTGWRRRHVFGALGVRQAVAEHSQAEAELLMRCAAGAHVVVELGVAEGGSAAELRSVMSRAGRLYLVDPYARGRLGVSMARIVARRTVNHVHGGEVSWLRARSDEAVIEWDQRIDFLFIDADHSYERAAADWRLWAPFVQPGGHVALHDSAAFPGGWTSERSGPVRLVKEIRSSERQWILVGQADSLSVFRRADIDQAPDAAGDGNRNGRPLKGQQ